MTQNRLSDLIAKKKAGEISPSELIELNALLKGDETAGEMLATIDTIWNVPLENDFSSDSYLNDRWQSLNSKLFKEEVKPEEIKKRNVVKLFTRYAAVAACAAAVVVGSWAAFRYFSAHEAPKQNIVSTKNGSRSKIELPDGTQVWLNAGSKLIYNEAYGKELREVKLIGEAFFDVTKDAEHPFVIHANEMNIKVLGTAFNVRAYPDDKRTEAALLRGLIEVSFNGRPSDRLYLKPNEKISVMNGEIQKMDLNNNIIADTKHPVNRNADEPLIAFSKISYESPTDSTILETAWVKNKFIFRNKSFEELSRDMERWYNVSFDFKDSLILQKHFTGSFYHESVIEALEILRLSYPFHYKVNKTTNSITIE
ncbi:MAG: FecR family protein [Filimonas sp.]|nr:FecR family protein [Filimonas sp.]